MTSHWKAFKIGFKRGETRKIKNLVREMSPLRFLKKMQAAAALVKEGEILRMND
jgi:hypothetical protein